MIEQALADEIGGAGRPSDDDAASSHPVGEGKPGNGKDETPDPEDDADDDDFDDEDEDSDEADESDEDDEEDDVDEDDEDDEEDDEDDDEDDDDDDGVERCGFIALIGAPNAGKSTLINALVGSKVAIVTPKVQTTRAPLRGIALEGKAQLIFVDTPGIFTARRLLDEAMVEAAWSGAGDADVIVLVVDVRHGMDDETSAIIDGLAANGLKAHLVLNKIDLVRRDELLAIARAFNERFPFGRTFMISALNSDGVAELRRFLANELPEGPWLYPEDQIADAPLRQIAAEITREQLYLKLHQELPYASTVETEAWTENPDGSVRIDQVIFVEREGQKKIVLGKGGATIKDIGQAARREISAFLERRVHLFLFVKVRENWAQDPERLRMMGLEMPGRKQKQKQKQRR